MDIEKFTERAAGLFQAAQTIAIRDFHQQISAGASAQGVAG
jgi:ATP-dependent Clp protease ATP-binding subunit ClpB